MSGLPEHKPDAEVPKNDESFAEVFARAKQYVRRLGPASVLALLAFTLPIAGTILLLSNINRLGSRLRENLPGSIYLYSIGFMVLAGIALLPTYSTAFLGGWAFGFSHGLLAALAGFTGGAVIGYAIARPTASARVESLIAEKPRWKVVHDALVRGSPLRTLAIVTLLRIPSSPFALTNLVLAAVRVPLPIYVLGTLVGMTPRTAVMVYLASRIQQSINLHDAAGKKPWWFIAIGLGATIIVLTIIGLIANKALKKITTAHAGPAVTSEE